MKFQCLSIIKNNKTICECANRRVPCDKNLYMDTKDNCENRTTLEKEQSSTFLKTADRTYQFICVFLMIIFVFS
jgi:hypothetical protein